MAVNPDVYVTGKFNSVASVVANTPELDLGTAEFALRGYGSQIPRVPNQGMLSLLTRPIPANTAAQDLGTFSAYLWNNTLIEPAGTYYTLTIRDANGDAAQVNAYRFTEPGEYDIDGIDPYDPIQPPPSLPPLITNLLLIVADADDAFFDGSQYTAWKITLTQNVTGAYFGGLVSGNIYTFIIVQDSVGNHIFQWPSGPTPYNLHNPTQVCPTANSTTVQSFVADDKGVLWPIGPGTWYTP
jgi:hypothetical protein